jgi:putative phosphoribosyl transferase
MKLFDDRGDAGRKLAQRLGEFSDREDVMVLALPRGGVAVGYEVANALHVPLEVFVVRKLGVPGCEELAMGAITGSGVRVLNDDVVHSFEISQETLDFVAERELEELRRRESEYREDRPIPEIEGKVVILVDDGLATGASMRAAVLDIRNHHPGKIVVAIPTGARGTCMDFKKIADEVICLSTPDPFFGVGAWYRDFTQLTDDQVKELLRRANEPVGSHKT